MRLKTLPAILLLVFVHAEFAWAMPGLTSRQVLRARRVAEQTDAPSSRHVQQLPNDPGDLSPRQSLPNPSAPNAVRANKIRRFVWMLATGVALGVLTASLFALGLDEWLQGYKARGIGSMILVDTFTAMVLIPMANLFGQYYSDLPRSEIRLQTAKRFLGQALWLDIYVFAINGWYMSVIYWAINAYLPASLFHPFGIFSTPLWYATRTLAAGLQAMTAVWMSAQWIGLYKRRHERLDSESLNRHQENRRDAVVVSTIFNTLKHFVVQNFIPLHLRVFWSITLSVPINVVFHWILNEQQAPGFVRWLGQGLGMGRWYRRHEFRRLIRDLADHGVLSEADTLSAPLQDRLLRLFPELHRTVTPQDPDRLNHIFRTIHRLAQLVAGNFEALYHALPDTVKAHSNKRDYEGYLNALRNTYEGLESSDMQEALWLAVILHDVGVSVALAGHAEHGARLTSQLAHRVGLRHSLMPLVEQAIRYHWLFGSLGLGETTPRHVLKVLEEVSVSQREAFLAFLQMVVAMDVAGKLGAHNGLWPHHVEWLVKTADVKTLQRLDESGEFAIQRLEALARPDPRLPLTDEEVADFWTAFHELIIPAERRRIRELVNSVMELESVRAVPQDPGYRGLVKLLRFFAHVTELTNERVTTFNFRIYGLRPHEALEPINRLLALLREVPESLAAEDTRQELERNGWQHFFGMPLQISEPRLDIDPHQLPARSNRADPLETLRTVAETINDQLQEELQGMAMVMPHPLDQREDAVYSYPFCCGPAAYLSQRFLQAVLSPPFTVELIEGRREVSIDDEPSKVVHYWVEVTANDRRFFLSFNEGQFALYEDLDLRLLASEDGDFERFWARYTARGLNRFMLEEIRDESFYASHKLHKLRVVEAEALHFTREDHADLDRLATDLLAWYAHRLGRRATPLTPTPSLLQAL